MKYSFKDIENESIDEIKENIFDNIDTLTKLLSEVERLRLGYYNTHTEVKDNNNSDDKSISVIENLTETDNSLIEEISYYYLRVRDFDLQENRESLNKLKIELPSKRKSNYQDIILGINAFLMKDINEIKNFIETEKSILSKEELTEFKTDIFDIQKKINAIFYLSRDNVLELESHTIEEENNNNIVFLETDSENIYALEDLDNNSVPNDYYEGFYELIHSIENGTFKNAKYLTGNNNGTAGMSEVKGFKKRVIFDRVGYDTYVIVGAFIKKSDMDKGYIDQLKNRIAIYRKNRDNIVKMINEKENYLEEQREILEQIYELLKPNRKKRG